MPTLGLKLNREPVQPYHAASRQCDGLAIRHETAVAFTFHDFVGHGINASMVTVTEVIELQPPE